MKRRPRGHGEPVVALKVRGILLHGTTTQGEQRLSLQIFSQTRLGPVLFECIQRKHDQGFGEGNFKALVKSIEGDQMRCGAITIEQKKTEGD